MKRVYVQEVVCQRFGRVEYRDCTRMRWSVVVFTAEQELIGIGKQLTPK